MAQMSLEENLIQAKELNNKILRAIGDKRIPLQDLIDWFREGNPDRPAVCVLGPCLLLEQTPDVVFRIEELLNLLRLSWYDDCLISELINYRCWDIIGWIMSLSVGDLIKDRFAQVEHDACSEERTFPRVGKACQCGHVMEMRGLSRKVPCIEQKEWKLNIEHSHFGYLELKMLIQLLGYDIIFRTLAHKYPELREMKPVGSKR
jgi:hypothetical protein